MRIGENQKLGQESKVMVDVLSIDLCDIVGRHFAQERRIEYATTLGTCRLNRLSDKRDASSDLQDRSQRYVRKRCREVFLHNPNIHSYISSKRN